MSGLAGVEVRAPEFAVLDITGSSLLSRPKTESTVLPDGAEVEKLAGGFLNISRAAVDAAGTLHFADTRENPIYRGSAPRHRAEVVREVPQRPTSLAFGGPDRKTLFLAARFSLYSVRTFCAGANGGK